MAFPGISMRRLTRHLASLPFSPQQRQSSIVQSTDSSVIPPSAAFTSNERQSSQSKTLDDKQDNTILSICASLTFIYMMITTNGQSVKNEVMPLLVSMNQRIEKTDVKMDENKKELEARLNKIDSKIDRLEGKMDENKKELEARLNETKRELEGKMEKLEGKMDGNFKSLNEKLDRLAEKKRWLW